DNLSPSIQNLINKTALIGGALTFGLGPLLIIFGLLGGAIAKVALSFGAFFKWIGKAKVLGVFAKTAADGTKKLGL
ncbi:hypothetical protein ACWE42_25710, partial [Sutcliffiella cohnii]